MIESTSERGTLDRSNFSCHLFDWLCSRDSGVRDALHQLAQDERCRFPGLGPTSFRRTNIT